jgi:hypothetical protein
VILEVQNAGRGRKEQRVSDPDHRGRDWRGRCHWRCAHPAHPDFAVPAAASARAAARARAAAAAKDPNPSVETAAADIATAPQTATAGKSAARLTLIYEQNVNRPDSTWDLDVLNVGAKDYHACDAPCLGRADCKSYVYLKPGVRGPDAYCVLKSELPIASLNQVCCVSGVVKERALVPGP